MTAANGSAVKYYYVEEVSGAIPASPTFTPIRFNTSSIARNTAQVDSNEINTSRQRPPAKQGTYSLAGDIVSELSDDSFDDLLAIAFQSDWSSNTLKVGSDVRSIALLKRHTDLDNGITATTLSATASDSSFNDSGSGFTFAVGDIITVSGFTGDTDNNGVFKVATASASKITVTDTDGDAVVLVDDAAGESVTITSHVDYIYRGCRVNTVAVSAQVDARVQMTFGLIGTEAEEYGVPTDATLSAAGTSEPMVTSAGSLTEGGNAIACVTSMDFTLSNGMAPLFVLFRRNAYDVQNSVFTASGTLSAYRESGSLYAKFLSETETSIVVEFSDGTNTRTFTFPKVIYTQADDPVAGPDAIVNQFTFSAGYDSGTSTTVTVARSA